MPESPQAALLNNNDNYHAYKDVYFAKYRICDQGKHIPAVFNIKFLELISPLSLRERARVRALPNYSNLRAASAIVNRKLHAIGMVLVTADSGQWTGQGRHLDGFLNFSPK